MYPKEEIPPEDTLYYRVHHDYVDDDGEPEAGAFKQRANPSTGIKAMSCDWSRYSSANDARSRCKEPAKNCIVSFLVESLINIDTVSVEHDPLYPPPVDNRAHSGVQWPESNLDNTRVRNKLLALYSIEIQIEIA